MSKFVRISNLLVSILTLSIPGSAQTSVVAQTEPGLRVAVRVYNMAKISGGTLDQGEKEASRISIFRDAGITLAWRECPSPQKLGPTELMLRMNPRLSGSMRSYFGSGDLGFAPWDSRGGVLASIFYHRVEQLSMGSHTVSSWDT